MSAHHDGPPPPAAHVDHDRCAGVAQCIQIAPGAFSLDDELLSVFEPSGSWTPEQLRGARDSCPMEAITLAGGDEQT